MKSALLTMLASVLLCLGFSAGACAEDGRFAVPTNTDFIDAEAFAGCAGMTGIEIPLSVTEIGCGAFQDCDGLTDVYYAGNAEQWDAILIADGNAALTGALLHFAGAEPERDTQERVIAYGGYEVEFGARELAVSSTAGMDNPGLAGLCAMMSDAAYSEEGAELAEIYRRIFDGTEADIQFDDESGGFASSFALGEMMILGVKTHVLFITIRGTEPEKGYGMEVWADVDPATQELWGRETYRHVISFEGKVLSRLDAFLEKHPEIGDRPLKIVITGHSLGGGTANLLTARFTQFAQDDAWWTPIAGKDDIYCYTFGGIDTLFNPDCETVISNGSGDFPVRTGFENIHNLYNLYDPMGPAGNVAVTPAGNTAIGKYGHMEFFAENVKTSPYEVFINHSVSTYLHAVFACAIPEQSGDTESEIIFITA